MPTHRLLIKINKENLPQVKDRYPFLYLERGKLLIDDSSVKWIDSDCNVIRIPIAMLSTLLLGPGTSITHEAIKVLAAANCTVCWVGEDSFLFYAVGESTTSDSRNFRKQMMLAADPVSRLEVARRMFEYRFPKNEVEGRTLQELMGVEGKRVKQLYEQKAHEYGVGWVGRSFIPGHFKMSDTTNRILTASNAALYGLVSSVVYATGFSPHIGFIHTGSPLPFVYDIADLYKGVLCIDLAFYLTRELGGDYNRERIADEFRQRVIEFDLLNRIVKDIEQVLGKN